MDNSIASGGSGENGSGSSRSSAPNLLFAIPLLLLGLVLLSTTRRFFRVKTSLGLGLCTALAAWALTVSRQGSGHLSDLVIWGITSVLFLVGAVLGATVLWPLGLAGLSVSAAFALALSILLMGHDGLIKSSGGSWGLLAAFGLVSLACLALIKAKWRSSVELIQASLCGAFLFCVAIDLFANGAEGASRGLRHILDTNSYHRPYLSYSPRLSTRLLMVLFWLLTPISAYAQYRIFPIAQPSPNEQKLEADEAPVNYVTYWSEQDPEKLLTPNATEEVPHSKGISSPQMSQLPIIPKEPSRAEMRAAHESAAASLAAGNQAISRPYRAHLRGASISSSSSFSSSSSSSSGHHNSGQYSRPRPYSSPSAHARTNSLGAPPRHHRHSSALPLPSMSALISPEIDVNGYPLPSPPNSRNNSRRNSWAIGYTTPPMMLKPHTEEERRVDVPKLDSVMQDEKETLVPNTKETELGEIEEITVLPKEGEEETASKLQDLVIPVLALHSREDTATTLVDQPCSSSSSVSSGNSDSSHSSYEDPLASPITPLEASPITLYQSSAGFSSDKMHVSSIVIFESQLVGDIAAPVSTKHVNIRWTVDDWATFEDIPASGGGGGATAGNEHLARWSFQIPLSKLGGPGSRVQLAARAVFENGREEWDSNNGQNYVLTLP